MGSGDCPTGWSEARDKVGAPDSTAFPSRLHDPAIAARLGAALAVTFTLCFLTGLVSHYMQEPPSWASWPSRPVNLFRLNQGLHVLSGIASVPLLLAKLWTVYPQLFQRPALRSIGHGLERAFVLLLVGGATFQLVTGLINVASFYPFGFSFRAKHFAVAFVTYGALLVHVAHKIHIARPQLATPLPREPSDRGLTRRGFLAVTGGASALLVVGLARADRRAAEGLGALALPVRDAPAGRRSAEPPGPDACRDRRRRGDARSIPRTGWS